jgi:hypothetical protein
VQWVANGQVDPNDLFWRNGMVAAAPAHTVQPFAFYFRPTRSDDPSMRWLVPTGRSPWAIVAGYLGLFSVLGVFGPFAIVTGVVAIRDIRRRPHLHGMGRAVFGIVAGSLGTLGLLLVVLTG